MKRKWLCYALCAVTAWWLIVTGKDVLATSPGNDIIPVRHEQGSSIVVDAGNFRGNSNYGGSSFRGNSDFGGSSFRRNSDFGYDDRHYRSTRDDSLFDWIGLYFIMRHLGPFLFILLMFYLIKKRKSSTSAPVRSTEYEIDHISLQRLQQMDPAFSISDMEQKVAKMFVQLQQAWASQRFELARPLLSSSLYAQLKLQLDELRSSAQINHIERIAVLTSKVIRYEQESENDVLKCYLYVRMVDYTTNRKGEVIVGNPQSEVFMEYMWELIRSGGVKTATLDEKPDVLEHHCPNCGAPIDIEQSTQCPYCGTILKAKTHDWVLHHIDGISQKQA